MECASKGDGIRVNSVHPGIIDTPIWNKIRPDLVSGGRNAPIDVEEMARLGAPLADLIRGMAGIRWRVSRKSLTLFKDWVSKPSCPRNHSESHPPCTTIRLNHSDFQRSEARNSRRHSMVGALPPMAV
jgi:hypothetical protein